MDIPSLSIVTSIDFRCKGRAIPLAKADLSFLHDVDWRDRSSFALVCKCSADIVSQIPFVIDAFIHPVHRISDITALWNSNAFWAYLFTVKLNRMSFERNKVFAVAIASIGALAIVYGGSASQVVENSVSRYPAPILGDFMALIASIWYGLFQVLYKKFIALPNDPEILHGQRAPLIPNDIDFSTEDEDPEHDVEEALPKEGPLFDEIYPPPFGFHSNFFISTVGLLTIIVMAIPFPFLDYMGWEEFAWPSERSVIIAIILIASMGLIFNAGFMVRSSYTIQYSLLTFVHGARSFLVYGGP